jgi:hypothetical protein
MVARKQRDRERKRERERECLCYELSPFLLLFYLDLQSMGWFHTFRPCLLPLADPPWKLLTDTPRVGYTNLLGASQSNQVDNQDYHHILYLMSSLTCILPFYLISLVYFVSTFLIPCIEKHINLFLILFPVFKVKTFFQYYFNVSQKF